MTSTTMTREQRIDKVTAANAALTDLIAKALKAEGKRGEAAAWEAVEAAGATVHRQARLLAGKRRGG